MILQLSVINMAKEGRFNYTDGMQATLMSSYFYGYVSIMGTSQNANSFIEHNSMFIYAVLRL